MLAIPKIPARGQLLGHPVTCGELSSSAMPVYASFTGSISAAGYAGERGSDGHAGLSAVTSAVARRRHRWLTMAEKLDQKRDLRRGLHANS